MQSTNHTGLRGVTAEPAGSRLCCIMTRLRLRPLISAMLLGSIVLTPPATAQLGLGKLPAQDTAPAMVSPASPRAAVQEFLRHANGGDWEGAASFLAVPPSQRDRAEALARRLKTVIDQRLALDVSTLSPLVSGDTLDGDLNGDRIADLTNARGREEPLRVVRLNGPRFGGSFPRRQSIRSMGGSRRSAIRGCVSVCRAPL